MQVTISRLIQTHDESFLVMMIICSNSSFNERNFSLVKATLVIEKNQLKEM
jgi:hypothetical protein